MTGTNLTFFRISVLYLNDIKWILKKISEFNDSYVEFFDRYNTKYDSLEEFIDINGIRVNYLKIVVKIEGEKRILLIDVDKRYITLSGFVEDNSMEQPNPSSKLTADLLQGLNRKYKKSQFYHLRWAAVFLSFSGISFALGYFEPVFVYGVRLPTIVTVVMSILFVVSIYKDRAPSIVLINKDEARFLNKNIDGLKLVLGTTLVTTVFAIIQRIIESFI